MPELRIPQELHRRVFELTLALYRVTDFFPQGEALKKQLREKANEIFGGVAEYGHSLDGAREAAILLAKIEAIKGYLEICRSMRFVRPINITVLEREYDFIADFLNKELNDSKRDPSATPQDDEDGSPLSTQPEQSSGERQANSGANAMESSSPTLPIDERKSNEASVVEPLATWDEFTEKESSPFVSNREKPMSDSKEKPMSDRKDEGLLQISRDITDRQKRILEYIQQTSQAKISDFYAFFNDISPKTIQRDLQDLVSKDILKKEGEKRWTTYSLNGVR